MKFYIAAQNQDDAKQVAQKLLENGHVVTARWINKEFNRTATYSESERMQIAIDDENDILSCDALILCAGNTKCSGGKFVEVGIALGKRKLIYILGHRENMLLWHPLCAQLNSIEDIIEHIEKPSVLKPHLLHCDHCDKPRSACKDCK